MKIIVTKLFKILWFDCEDSEVWFSGKARTHTWLYIVPFQSVIILILMLKIYFLKNYLYFVCCVSLSFCVSERSRSQIRICEHLLSPFTMWVPGGILGHQVWWEVILPPKTSFPWLTYFICILPLRSLSKISVRVMYY